MSAFRIGILDAGGGLFAETAASFPIFALGVLGRLPLRSPRTRGRGENVLVEVGVAATSARAGALVAASFVERR